MPIVYPDIVRGHPRDALTIPSSTDEVLMETFAQAFEENPLKAVQRWNELREAKQEGPRLSAETARAKLKDAGMERDLTVTEAGITQAALDTLMWRKKLEKRRQETFARSEGGFAEGAQRFGLAALTTLADPISMGLNFVPVVGQARYARWLAGARGMGGRLAVRGKVGAIEGTAGAALAEIPIYQMRTQEQADYDAVDSLMNVTLGGFIGAGLHTTVGTAGELIARRLPSREPAPRVDPAIDETGTPRAAEVLPADVQRALFESSRMGDVVDSLSAEARHAALRAAVGQAVEGRAINVERILNAEPLRPLRSPEFRSWFSQSRATDEAGEPLTVHMGSKILGEQSQPEQDIARFTRGEGGPTLRFSMDAASASDSKFAAHLAVRNPATSADVESARRSLNRLSAPANIARDVAWAFGARQMPADRFRESDVIDVLKQRGFDSIHEPGSPNWEVFSADQIRPAVQFRPNSSALISALASDDAEWRAASQHAEATLARDVPDTSEANLKAAEEEADFAMAEARELAARLGVRFDDPELTEVTDMIAKAERWARAAELATVCLTRGG